MNRIRTFVPLGIPANAVKLIGKSAEFAVAPWAQVLAFEKSGSQAVISAGQSQQISILNSTRNAEDSWKVHESVLLSQQKNQFALAAPGGLYRVDIGYGSEFICAPRQVMGTLGELKTKIIYSESRLDVAQVWFQLAWKSLYSATSKGVHKVSYWLSKVPISSWFPNLKLPTVLKRPIISPKIQNYLKVSSQNLRKFWRLGGQKIFYWTHPPRLLIKGPCSILIKP